VRGPRDRLSCHARRPAGTCRLLAALLRARRHARGTRRKGRALTCFRQAPFALVWFRTREDLTVLGAGFGISRATAYRYRDEAVAVLSAAAQDLTEALNRFQGDDWSHVILDGKIVDTDRCRGQDHQPPRRTDRPVVLGKRRCRVPRAAVSCEERVRSGLREGRYNSGSMPRRSRRPCLSHPSAAIAAMAACGRWVPSLGRCMRSTSVKPARVNRSENSSTGQR
jgi:hypothetical protein